MIIKVQPIGTLTQYNHFKEHKQTKYYSPMTATRQNIKHDFQIVLDAEMEKLKVNVLI